MGLVISFKVTLSHFSLIETLDRAPRNGISSAGRMRKCQSVSQKYHYIFVRQNFFVVFFQFVSQADVIASFNVYFLLNLMVTCEN